ncbi:MAG: ABC transporter ATP-binding protein [Candidatus Muiribacteriota bacterium]
MNENNFLEVKSVSKSYTSLLGKTKKVLQDLNFNIKKNEIFGYLGSNGAGKTTTFKVILGLIRQDKGQIFFESKKPLVSVKNKIGFLPENPYFYLYLTPVEILALYGRCFGFKKKLIEDKIRYLLNLVELEDVKNIQLRKFSRGMLQRIGIAQALINDPDLLILDEPMSGLDPFGRKKMRDIIISCRELGKSVVFSSHILSDVEMICDRACILNNGTVSEIIDINDFVSKNIDEWELICKGKNNFIISDEKYGSIKNDANYDITIITIFNSEFIPYWVNLVKKEKLDIISLIPKRRKLEDIYITNYK